MLHGELAEELGEDLVGALIPELQRVTEALEGPEMPAAPMWPSL